MTLLAPPQKPLCHLNSVTHEGKVVVVATDTDGKIYYTVKQDGFEDSYLFQKPENRTGWEVWKTLELPYEDDDQSVVEEEKKELTDQNNPSVYLFRSRYKTKDQSAVAPVQLVSGLGYIYVFRQSKSNTLLVDRFVLDGLTNTLNRKLEVRFKRSKQKYKPYKSEKKENIGLINVDSLDYRDINGNNFYEPTTELSLVNNLANGWFSVVLLQTSEQDKYRWHIFAYNSQTQKVELTTLRASEEGLFDVKDYTILDPEPRSISGIIKRTLDLRTLTVAKGLTATKYDLQKERLVDGVTQLLRESVRVMLAVGTNQGNVAAISFAVAADGTLSQIKDSPDSTTVRRSNTRQILLPLNTLDEIKAIGTSSSSSEGIIAGFARRDEDDSVIITSNKASGLNGTEVVKVTGNKDYNRLYSQVTRIDDNTFEVTLESSQKNTNGGNWEVIPKEETGLTFNGMVTAYEITSAGKLKVTAFNHGLVTGDAVQIVDTKNYDGTYTVTKVDDNKFSLDGVKWQSGTAITINKKLDEKRRGVTFDGVDDYISCPDLNTDFSQGITVEAWVWFESLTSWSSIIDLGNGFQADSIVFGTDKEPTKLRLTTYKENEEKGIVGGKLETGKWIHVAATINALGNADLYINGIDLGSSIPVYLPRNLNRTKNYIGKTDWDFSTVFKGKISDVRIWNQARKEDEIKNSMYLQLTGKELGLVGYWRLDAIVEDKERKVIDFSVNGNDGTVNGGAYVSSASLKRYLDKDEKIPAIKYENEELFAVTERATYTEEFEFKTDNNVDPNNVDGGKIFGIIYKGKKSRSSQDWIPITAEATQFTDLGNSWWKASSRFTVQDGVSMVRSFGIYEIKGIWKTLDIRKHKIQLVSDSITEEKYADSVNDLIVLADNQLQLQKTLETLELQESQEALLLKEKRELDFKINAYNNQQETRTQRDQLKIKLNALIEEEKNLRKSYEDQLNNPLQDKYECKIVAKHSGKFLEVLNGTQNNGAIVQQWDWNGADRQKWRFEQVDGDYYKIISCASGKVLNVDGASSVDGANVSQWDWANVDQQKWSVTKLGDGSYKIIAKHSGKGLDVSGVSTSNGARIQQFTWVDFDSRKWIIESLSKEEAKRAWEAKKQALDSANDQLKKLDKALTATPEDKDNWNTSLKRVIKEIKNVQTGLNNSNTDFIAGVKVTQQISQKMRLLKKDKQGLQTEAALLGFVLPASRISAIETCEGNVQLSYFDDQGRMRQTNFDATSDSKNPTLGQWIPDSLRTCLNFDNNSSIVTLPHPIVLPKEWTIEAWFVYPLPETEQWNTLIQGQDQSRHVIVKKEGKTDLLGISLPEEKKVMQFDGVNDYISCPLLNPDFSTGITVESWVWYDNFTNWSRIIDFGTGQDADNIIFANEGTSNSLVLSVRKGNASQAITIREQLERGKWMHLAATIDISGNAKLYKNGIQIGTGSVHLPKTLDRTSNYIGKSNWSNDGYFNGKISDVRIWNKARTQDEIQADMNKRLTGKEAGLVVYYPLDKTTTEASVTKVLDLVNSKNGTMIGKKLKLVVDQNLPVGFVSSGYDLTQLSSGWHHLTAVAQGEAQDAKTTFYINGNKVGEAKSKVVSNVSAIGNSQGGGQQFGKVAEVRIWEIALSAEEITLNSKTVLTGNEPDLLAYYPFNDSDTIAQNRAGNNDYNGTMKGASPWGCAAPIGNLGDQVMQFDGVNNYIEVPYQQNLNPNQFTISCWVKVMGGQATWRSILTSRTASNTPSEKTGYMLYAGDDNKWQVWVGNGSDWFSVKGVDISLNVWTHISVTYDGNKLVLCINGIKSGDNSINYVPNSRFPLRIGAGMTETSSGGSFFNGQISEVRIWNKARTEAEIQADMNKRLTGKEAGLVAYYPLNSTKPEGSTIKVLDLVNNNHGTVTGAFLVSDQTLAIGGNALVSSEYSTVSKDKTAMMRRFFAVPTPQGVKLLPDKRIEQLELKWIGNGQFAPTLLGYIEGAPPIPSENLTLEDNYNGATSVELSVSEDVTFNWKRSQDSGLGLRTDIFYGTDVEIGQEFLGFSSRVAKVRAGFKGNLDFSYQFQNESSIAASSSLNMADKLQLVGTQEQNANFPHLGKRFIPKNVGYALVVSALADVFVTRLRRTGKMIGYQVLPVENIPPDVNTITFLINPAYTMSGSLDGLTGSSATSIRFFKHVPAMRSQFGSLYPASYYRLQEAYDLKKQIEQQDKDREAYFANFNSRLLDEASLDRETNKGDAPKEISVNKSEDKPNDNLTDEQRKAADKEKQVKLQQETKAAQDQQSKVVKKKQSEIDTKIQDEGKRNHATASFAKWQKNMEDIQIRAGKRNIVNTYVWDADGGLRSESQSFANTAEHSIGGSFSLNAGLGMDYATGATVFAVELTAQATLNLTQTMTKTETRSKGIQLNIDLSGVEGRSVTDYNDSPILPGEKVNRYRFMSFYLEGSTNNFNDFFSYVVDPEWLASNSEEARALRQARGKANKAWRVLHRVTYVERPALMGFGRDIRQLPSVDVSENQELLDKITALEESNKQLEAKLDQILKALKN